MHYDTTNKAGFKLDTTTTAGWSKLVGIDTIGVNYGMPSYLGGAIQAAYIPKEVYGEPIIGVTPLLASFEDAENLKALIAHEFGHAAQEAFDAHYDSRPSKVHEDGADAIAGILLGEASNFEEAFHKMEFFASILGFTHSNGPDAHDETEVRIARVKKWADWAKDKTDDERKDKIQALARREITP